MCAIACISYELNFERYIPQEHRSMAEEITILSTIINNSKNILQLGLSPNIESHMPSISIIHCRMWTFHG